MSDLSYDAPDFNEIDPSSGRWIRASAWIIAIVVFELTADPSLVVMVGCTKFGWEQLRAARWLRRTDPDKRRGRACRWFYVSWGLWRISVVATLMMFVVLFLFEGLRHRLGAPPRRGNEPPVQFIVAFLMAFFGIGFATMTSILGVLSAWRGGVRVWVGAEAIDGWRVKSWPPLGPPRKPNRVALLLLTAVPIAAVSILLPVAAFVVGIAATVARRIGGDGAFVATMLVGVMLCLVAGVIAMMVLVDASKRRIEASSPADCWGDQLETPPPSTQIMFGRALR